MGNIIKEEHSKLELVNNFEKKIQALKNELNAVDNPSFSKKILASLENTHKVLNLFYLYDIKVNDFIKFVDVTNERLNNVIYSHNVLLEKISKKSNIKISKTNKLSELQEKININKIEISGKSAALQSMKVLFEIYRNQSIINWSINTYFLSEQIFSLDKSIYPAKVLKRKIRYLSNLTRSKTVITLRDIEEVFSLNPALEKKEEIKTTNSMLNYFDNYTKLISIWSERVKASVEEMNKAHKEISESLQELSGMKIDK